MDFGEFFLLFTKSNSLKSLVNGNFLFTSPLNTVEIHLTYNKVEIDLSKLCCYQSDKAPIMVGGASMASLIILEWE